MSQKTISFWHPASLISTCFGVGKIPFAPGTFGSVAGVLLFSIISAASYFGTNDFQVLYYIVAIIVVNVVGTKATDLYCKISNGDDPKEVVIDEVAGQLIASTLAYLYTSNPFASLLIPFLLFRFFDIVKPGPVGWADRNVKGAWGVMLDDIIAGVLAGITSALVFLAF